MTFKTTLFKAMRCASMMAFAAEEGPVPFQIVSICDQEATMMSMLLNGQKRTFEFYDQSIEINDDGISTVIGRVSYNDNLPSENQGINLCFLRFIPLIEADLTLSAVKSKTSNSS